MKNKIFFSIYALGLFEDPKTVDKTLNDFILKKRQERYCLQPNLKVEEENWSWKNEMKTLPVFHQILFMNWIAYKGIIQMLTEENCVADLSGIQDKAMKMTKISEADLYILYMKAKLNQQGKFLNYHQDIYEWSIFCQTSLRITIKNNFGYYN